MEERIIIHLDMDAFFASVEQHDNPDLRGKPVVIGADPKGGAGRGVVSTCSYEARRYGIHSAQPVSKAYHLCPDAIFLPVRGERYAEVSKNIRSILFTFTPCIEPISIDEAFLDVTGSAHLFGGKYEIAHGLQERVYQKTGLTASLGAAPNKMLAKIASDLEKPNGMVIVEKNEIQDFLHPLSISKLWGVGPKTAASLKMLGIETIGDIARRDAKELENRFGQHGRHLWLLSQGIDDRPVKEGGPVKSIGHEHTFGEDTDDKDQIEKTLMRLCEKVAFRLRRKGLKGRCISTKIRFEDFKTYSRSHTSEEPLNTAHEIYGAALKNYERVASKGRKIRLIGVSLSMLGGGVSTQTSLFDQSGGGTTSREKWARLTKTIDQIQSKHGIDAVRRGKSLS